MQRKRVMALAVVLLGVAVWHVDVRRQPGVGLTLVPVALADTCSCPTTYCDNGKLDGCSIECPSNQEAVCTCAAFCDPGGNPSGLNKCRCQPLQNG